MPDTTRNGLAEYAAICYLNPDTARFEKTPGGFLSLNIGPDEKYPRINLHRAFPFTGEESFISVRDHEGKEIGMIRSTVEFPVEIRKLFDEEIGRRYFAPVIKAINSIKEEFGYSYWDVATDSGSRRFTVRGGHSSVISVTDSRLLIVDVDGNRFEVPDYRALDSKSYNKLRIFL